ncbi:hypothetical protein LSH36_1091g00239 [Paralvinella palmiformis]|uniref:Chaperone protein HtpG n=1 Tax=Paralvinella palmiformis TaxID=53620 RepID=A0AAD9IVQ4_9ANNE|nr:hypothetical protein LSH36_1091g00239 [Paralvinella palmiformis]
MSRDELQENLGTIARSGTKHFLEQAKSSEQGVRTELIGQFGVGFYSVFMVGKKVEVVSKKVGESEAWKWISHGEGNFTIEQADREEQGTTVRIYLNQEAEEYASKWNIETLVKKYSNHVSFPIFLQDLKAKEDPVQLNAATALWKKKKTELTKEDYEEFYKGLSEDNEAPLFYLHTQAEGALEYTTLFYIPAQAPFDLFNAEYQSGVKLYIKRVFITDERRELLPSYLRFVRGIIDSEDLPLNVSREMIQDSKVLHTIRNASVKRILTEFERISKANPQLYTQFIRLYNKPLKEGMYTDFINKDKIVSLIRFHSSHSEDFVSLEEYVSRMPAQQKAIYYLSGDSLHHVKISPLVATYQSRSIEVLFLVDEIDEVIVPAIGKYKEYELKPINRAGVDADIKQESDTLQEKSVSSLVKKMRDVLQEQVKDIQASGLLKDTPCCAVWDAQDPSRRMQQIMSALGQKQEETIKPILEINPTHPIIKKLDDIDDENKFRDISMLLFEGALLMEGSMPADSTVFVQRMNRMLENSF